MATPAAAVMPTKNGDLRSKGRPGFPNGRSWGVTTTAGSPSGWTAGVTTTGVPAAEACSGTEVPAADACSGTDGVADACSGTGEAADSVFPSAGVGEETGARVALFSGDVMMVPLPVPGRSVVGASSLRCR